MDFSEHSFAIRLHASMSIVLQSMHRLGRDTQEFRSLPERLRLHEDDWKSTKFGKFIKTLSIHVKNNEFMAFFDKVSGHVSTHVT
ncbi:hypothetical protein BpHYR1_020258 [Brachionus plicatilis]|uniref:Uncharacterized protein n=1 Tax=Brachionus plicatilis TaxID=10195 RepID=A0A3M7QJ47_BRAPC|nr:hypothetical protein BpHYR1_020258 [Brachionus plicatilis]